MGVKEIYRKLDEINRLVEFTSRMKTELKGDAEEMNFLKRTHNSLFKINEKIQSINEKIKGLTE
jgi:tetrahydromethanopterin S-methyltransferase subunit G